MPYTEFDPILRKHNEDTLLNQIRADTRAAQAAAARSQRELSRPAGVSVPSQPIPSRPLTAAEEAAQRAARERAAARKRWVDKVVLYAALLLAVAGFGLGFAATSDLESWQPLIGAGFGAAAGFAIPHVVRMAVEAIVEYIEEHLIKLGFLAAVAIAGGIFYLTQQ